LEFIIADLDRAGDVLMEVCLSTRMTFILFV
jgi:hypothetical protein